MNSFVVPAVCFLAAVLVMGSRRTGCSSNLSSDGPACSAACEEVAPDMREDFLAGDEDAGEEFRNMCAKDGRCVHCSFCSDEALICYTEATVRMNSYDSVEDDWRQQCGLDEPFLGHFLRSQMEALGSQVEPALPESPETRMQLQETLCQVGCKDASVAYAARYEPRDAADQDHLQCIEALSSKHEQLFEALDQKRDRLTIYETRAKGLGAYLSMETCESVVLGDDWFEPLLSTLEESAKPCEEPRREDGTLVLNCGHSDIGYISQEELAGKIVVWSDKLFHCFELPGLFQWLIARRDGGFVQEDPLHNPYTLYELKADMETPGHVCRVQDTQR